ncbi:MAG: polymer-forming cytoskeletal protein [Rhodospirillaceae bacterium]|nr:polymer-forming cytoskeletal protein [Rhodospirillaceae bacterium]
MFSKADKTKAAAKPARTVPSLVSTDLEISGNLQTPGEIQLDGTVEGDITCGKLMVGEKASITGHIEADEVVIRGKIMGRVKARSVHLANTAHVTGDIWYDSLAIEAGAFLDGHCKRNDAPPTAVTATHRTAEVVTVRDNAGKSAARS